MYSKDELLAKDNSELISIANDLQLNADDYKTKDELVYAILDQQAVDEGNKNPLSPARHRRTRILKKDTERVYTVNGKSGENLDSSKGKANQPQPLFKPLKKVKRPRVAQQLPQLDMDEAQAQAQDVMQPAEAQQQEPVAETPSVAQQLADLQNELDSLPKHRGPKSKRERELIEKIDALRGQLDDAPQSTDIDSDDDAGPSFDYSASAGDTAVDKPAQDQPTTAGTAPDKEIISKLQAKMNLQNQTATEPAKSADSVWAGDPCDGTDFIVVHDLPIEDQGRTQDFDMLDNPVTPNYSAPAPQPAANEPAPAKEEKSKANFEFNDIITANGVLEIMPDGYGFLRSSDYNYMSSPDDVYVSTQQVRRYALKTGDVVQCHIRPPHEGEKYFPLTSIDLINGRQPSEIRDRIPFENLTPLFPNEKFNLCGDPATTNPSTRIVDLFSPIGKGQRALIVAQPKTGKTILMKNIANAMAANHPEAYLMMLLIDERPEEVTDMARTVNAEVIASTFDEPADHHVKLAGIVLEKAKRLVECGHDVVIFLDSITRLARAYNTVAPASGKVLTGGVDANALQKPKRFFGAARNIENGGSLTIVATALIDTGSKMDEVIFEEFKGTGNMELQLDRTLSNKRIFPAVNLIASSTRRDDLLQDQTTLNRMQIIRDNIADMTPLEAIKVIRDHIVKTKDNEEFLLSINS